MSDEISNIFIQLKACRILPKTQLSEMTQHLDIGCGYPTFTSAPVQMSKQKPRGVRKYLAQINPNPFEYRPSISKISQDYRLGIIEVSARCAITGVCRVSHKTFGNRFLLPNAMV